MHFCLPIPRAVWTVAQVASLDGAGHLMLINVLLILLIAGFSAGIVLALVRRSVRERVEAERLAAMGTATARILHQVKNPLQTILLHAEMLEDERIVEEAALRGEVSRAIVGEAMRMTDLLSELSAYASGVGRRLDLQPMPLHALVHDVTETVTREASQEGVRVRIGLLEEVTVHGDPYFLHQALGNLLRNAREALSEQGGVDALLQVGLYRRGAEVVVEVADNGPGIAADHLVHVFEPFVTTKGKGMGLGLPICREIVEGHGGRVELRSQPGVGTTAHLILPLSPAARSLQPA